MKDIEKCPTCGVAECAGCENGHCICLVNNNFGKRKCPFFKTKQQAKREKHYCEQRMANIMKGIMEG